MIECHIIALNRDNYEYALDILSANVAEELLIRNDLDGMLIFGDAADSQIPIGALICRIVREEGKVKEQYRCEIRYFYVRDIYRREGLGNMLFQNLLSRLENSRVSYIEAEFPLSLQLISLERFLEKEGFAFDTGVGKSFRLNLKDMEIDPPLEKDDEKEYTRLVDCNMQIFRELLGDFLPELKKMEIDPYIQYMPDGYYDPYGSSFLKREGKMCACLLIHKKPEGAFSLEFIASDTEEAERDLIELLYYAKLELIREYGDDSAEIEISINTSIGMRIADSIIKVPHIEVVTRAYLGLDR